MLTSCLKVKMQAWKRSCTPNLASVARKIIRNNGTVTAAVLEENDDVKLKPWKEIPGPRSWPIIGQLPTFLPGSTLTELINFQENLYKMYGPIVRLDKLLSRPAMLALFDPEAIAFVLRSENRNPIRPGFYSLQYYRKVYNKPNQEDAFKPSGLVTDHDEVWRQFRSTVNPVLMQPKTIKLYKSVVTEVANDMINRMRNIRNKENMLNGNFDTELNLWALESIGTIALGGRLGCFDPNLAENSPEKKLIQCVNEIFKISNHLDFGLSLWRFFPTRTFKKGMALYEEQEKLAKYFVTKARQDIKCNQKPAEEKGVLEKLLDIDERIAVIMACDMLFSGVDTTGTTMISCLYLLAKNQEKQDKLRKEVTSDDDSNQYLRACIKEAIRLQPVVSGNLRAATKDYNIHGYRIPKGTHFLFNHQYLSVMESQFPRAKEYIPERWIEDGPLSYKNAHPFAYSPFGFGSRMCIGRRIAELELETFLSKVMQNFKVEWCGPPPKIIGRSLNYFVGPFYFVFKDL